MNMGKSQEIIRPLKPAGFGDFFGTNNGYSFFGLTTGKKRLKLTGDDDMKKM